MKSAPSWSLTCSLLALALACQTAAPTEENPEGEAGSSSVGGRGSGDGGADSGRGGSSLNRAGTTSAPDPEVAVHLLGAEARMSGLLGDDLMVNVEGEGTRGALTSLALTLLDDAGDELVVFDADRDGSLDTGTTWVVPLQRPTTASFFATGVLPGFGREPGLATVIVALVDHAGLLSESMEVPVLELPLRELDEDCDPEGVDDTCAQGYSCLGGVCSEGGPPVIERGAYQENPDGPITRLEGQDPDSDVTLARVDFLDEDDQPVFVDLDGDEIAESYYFETGYGLTNLDGTYAFFMQGTPTFALAVPRVAVTVVDSMGNQSGTEAYDLSVRMTRRSGQSCDLGGFDACEEGTTCVANTSGANGTCTTAVSARRNICAAAPIVEVGSGATRITGWMAGVSAWDAPSTCLPPLAIGRPEAVVRVRLTEGVESLWLSTDEPETQHDTVMFVAAGCDELADPALLLACNDDSGSMASEITLSDVEDGDYYVLIESVPAEEGAFGLSVLAE